MTGSGAGGGSGNDSGVVVADNAGTIKTSRMSVVVRDLADLRRRAE